VPADRSRRRRTKTEPRCPHDPSNRSFSCLGRPHATPMRSPHRSDYRGLDKESVICGNPSRAVLVSVHASIDARCRPGPCHGHHGARWHDAKRWCGERRRPGPRTKSIGRCLSGRPELDRGRSGGDQPLQRFGLPALESQWPAARERGLPRKVPDTAGQDFGFVHRNVQGCDGPTLEFPARRPGQE
jgi:hypothetical protein